jgi:hypothetical protein
MLDCLPQLGSWRADYRSRLSPSRRGLVSLHLTLVLPCFFWTSRVSQLSDLLHVDWQEAQHIFERAAFMERLTIQAFVP